MQPGFTTEQVLALAPDASSAKAGRGLAAPRHWVSLGFTERCAWGECRGSGERPYQTQVDLSEPAFRCSCPSRKFPCKHGLGLLLLLAEQPSAFPAATGSPPDWVVQWLKTRDERSVRTQAKAEETSKPESATRASPESRDKAAQKRTQQREG